MRHVVAYSPAVQASLPWIRRHPAAARKTKHPDTSYAKAYRAIYLGWNDKGAAEFAGVTVETIAEWHRADPVFARARQDAEEAKRDFFEEIRAFVHELSQHSPEVRRDLEERGVILEGT